VVVQDVIDPRDIVEKTLLNGAESRALKAHADELGISKSALLRYCWLKCHREHVQQQALIASTLANSSEPGQV
jgi:hypothetical protein